MIVDPLRAELDAIRVPRRERLSLSLDADLINWAKKRARDNDVPVSMIVELALRRAVNRGTSDV